MGGEESCAVEGESHGREPCDGNGVALVNVVLKFRVDRVDPLDPQTSLAEHLPGDRGETIAPQEPRGPHAYVVCCYCPEDPASHPVNMDGEAETPGVGDGLDEGGGWLVAFGCEFVNVLRSKPIG